MKSLVRSEGVFFKRFKLVALLLSSVLLFSHQSFADDDLLADDDLTEETVALDKKEEKKEKKEVKVSRSYGTDPHATLLSENDFPSALQCAKCHKEVYEEWRISNHAYAFVSPMFHNFEQAANDLTSGSMGNFCVRCHGTISTTMKEPREMPIWERKAISREGITCVTCHRVNEEFGKVNGERRIVPGDIHAPIYGPGDGKVADSVIKQKDYYKVAPKKGDRGMKMHATMKPFKDLGESEFCVSCHQVAVHPQIKLEVVWDQYRSSPAQEKGVTCQECHMGKVPGMAEGYATGPAATIAGKKINPGRKRANHVFYGPGYPIAHPGVFPHNEKALQYSIKEWLKFDYRAKWGSDDFEEKVEEGKIKVDFPDVWSDPDDRAEAWEIIEENIKLLEKKKKLRIDIAENSSDLQGPFFKSERKTGEDLDFNYVIVSKNAGHNMPSGSLGAQPQLWLNIALTDPDGKNIWESGHVDSKGDVCDIHSTDVQQGKIKFDDQLVNLQTKFLTTNVKGTDREMFLPINFDIDQRPHIRPANAPNSVLNHPNLVRMEARSIPPLGSRKAKYSVPGELLKKPGKYRLHARMRQRAEPIAFMQFIGATTDMQRSMNEWIADTHVYSVEFTVKK